MKKENIGVACDLTKHFSKKLSIICYDAGVKTHRHLKLLMIFVTEDLLLRGKQELTHLTCYLPKLAPGTKLLSASLNQTTNLICFQRDPKVCPDLWLFYRFKFVLVLTWVLTRCSFRHEVIFKFNFCKFCTSCGFEIYWLFLKKLLLFKNTLGAILFHFCDSYLITLIFAHRRLLRCCFWHPMLRQNYLLTCRGAFYTPK